MLGRIAAAVIFAAAEVVPIPKLKPLPNPVAETAKATQADQQGTSSTQSNAPQPAPVVQQRNAPESGRAANTGAPDEKKGWFYGWSIGDKIALVVAIIAGLQFFALMLTYCVMDRAFKRQLRAYVSALPHGLVLHHDGQIRAIVNLKNTGQTPAFRTQTRSQILVKELPPKKPFVFQASDSGLQAPTYVMFPGGEHINAPIRSLTPEEFAKMRDGKHGLYVFGRVTFEDAFGRPQWTEFCAVLGKIDFKDWYTAAKENLGADVEARFKFTEGNNTATRH